MHKLGEWQTLQGSFTKIHNSFEERVKEVEAKERECDVAKNREKEVREWRESLELEKRLLGERCKAAEVGEKRNVEGFEWVKEKLKAVEERERVAKDGFEEMDLRAKVMSE
uniref:Uncharacterized protein n=1 Tax=Chenopodium quinoa TaxID=63459 RepID=A0A803KPG4_CHEQI